MKLSPEDFPAFFREMNDGHAPFPWQERLARDVFQNREWPKCLDLPTASGKTAVLDIAIFHLALEARLGAERRAPVRISLVVDRRLIVDQAHKRADRIKGRLSEGNSIAGKVAEELKALSGDEDVLVVQALRGGLPRESDWARTPMQPTVLLSTVDQVGSRLLFRGYGVSKSMRPVHAGLLGSDCLIFLDEAHLSEPFRQSLEWIEKYRGNPAPWAAVTMSATPGEKSAEPLLKAEDYAHPILGPRLSVAKPAELREIPATDIAASYAAAARELAAQEKIQRMLIVVNRVNLARSIFEELRAESPLLLTGRVREFDRERIVRQLEARFEKTDGKLFVVATQCIEAGVDLDFDGLVTQIAPIDALRQRFGRLNRTGRGIDAMAIVCATKEDISKRADPIYGIAAKDTWDELAKIAVVDKKKRIVDFGARVLPEVLGDEMLVKCSCERPDAPTMPPGYFDLWSCTNPSPSVEPEVALFLHGAQRASADVEVVWRKDLDRDELKDLIPLVALMPPRSGETLSVPVWNVRQWLAGANDADRVGDLEGEPDSNGQSPSGRPVLRWRGDDEPERILPQKIRPGDVILVPASYGGCDDWGWTGRADAPVQDDYALEASARVKSSQVAIRLHPALFGEEAWGAIRQLIELDYGRADEMLGALLELETLPASVRGEIEQFRPRAEYAAWYDNDHPSSGVVIAGRRSKRQDEPSTETDQLGSLGEISLLDHTKDVVNKVAVFAERAGLELRVRRALEFAAELHDSGKGDLRFQANLADGTPGLQILAKSRRRMTRQSMLPERWRHEALSVRVAIGDSRFSAQADSMDRELALWLIGTHHGWGRPFFPHDDEMDDRARSISDANGAMISLPASSGPQRLDFEWNGLDWTALFDRLQRRYGRWDLARLEAILRLADHRASEEGDERALIAGVGTR
ncbi:MAG: type I-U CRISPR-associated helicase/endonuclease Cas3 [Acidobacteriia bacterium]|nr:type I-U CRISPR-associated helicase/endonuclease Cas3 [Terriglobia bacterium]